MIDNTLKTIFLFLIRKFFATTELAEISLFFHESEKTTFQLVIRSPIQLFPKQICILRNKLFIMIVHVFFYESNGFVMIFRIKNISSILSMTFVERSGNFPLVRIDLGQYITRKLRSKTKIY